MSLHTSTVVWKFSQAKHANRLILLAIADYADDTGYAYPSVKSLSEKCQLSERQVQTGLRELQDAGELIVSIGTGRHRCNEYQITLAERYELTPTNIGASQSMLDRVQNVQGANHAGVQNVRQRVQTVRGKGAVCAPKGGTNCTQTVNKQPIERLDKQSGDSEGDSATVDTLPVEDDAIQSPGKNKPNLPKDDKPKTDKPEKSKRVSLAGSLLPEDWEPTARLLEWATNKHPTLDVKTQTEQFKRYFLSKSGTNALKRDWGLTWQTWMDRSATEYGNAPRATTLFTPQAPNRRQPPPLPPVSERANAINASLNHIYENGDMFGPLPGTPAARREAEGMGTRR